MNYRREIRNTTSQNLAKQLYWKPMPIPRDVADVWTIRMNTGIQVRLLESVPFDVTKLSFTIQLRPCSVSYAVDPNR